MDRLLSRRQGDPVGPSMDDRFTVEVVGSYANAAQDRACHLREEAFDQVEPGAVLWREDKSEAAITLSGEPFVGFLRHVRRMIVQDDLDRCIGLVGSIELLEEADEYARAMVVFDASVDLPGEPVDPRQQAQCPEALVFMVARDARHRRPMAGLGQCWRSPGCPVSHHKKRTRRSVQSYLPPRVQVRRNRPWSRQPPPLAGWQPPDKHIRLRPSWLQIPDRAAPGCSAPCAASPPDQQGSCTPCPAQSASGRRAPLPDHARGHGGPATASSRVRPDVPRPWAFGRQGTPATRASTAISGSLPGRGLSLSGAITPNRAARVQERWTVWCVTPTARPTA